MKKKSLNAFDADNWPLIIAASVMILCAAIVAIVPFFYLNIFGWWTVALALSGCSMITFCIMAVRYNDPSYILLDLFLYR